MSNQTEKCTEVMDHLALIVDGDEETLSRYADHLAECDTCRDARHDAALAAELVPHAWADYEHPEDLSQRVLAAIDERSAPQDGVTLPQGSSDLPGESAQEPAPPLLVTGEDAASPQRSVAPTVQTLPPKRSHVVRLVMAAAAVILVVAGAGGYLITRMLTRGEDSGLDPQSPTMATGANAAGTAATIAQIVRAAADSSTGVTVRAAGASDFEPVTVDTDLALGSAIRTDDRTRVRLSLADGTTLILNHNTELTFDGQTPRLVHVASGGEVLAEVAPVTTGPAAVFQTPTGRVEVLGTKLLVSATDETSSVRVTRGEVRVIGNDGSQAEAKAGEEALMPQSGQVSVSPAVNLAGSVAFAEMGNGEEGVERSSSGIGKLMAKNPRDRSGAERPLNLTNHKVRVRIVGNIARTEVEEIFRNDTSDTLEGIYSFPLPPDARIARLALEVDGELEEGAFVERDRAAKIWAGVLRKAGRRPQPLQQEEFIWVPGPWRDPALLEWQRGGQFELRIFPIKGNSSRRVILAYEQTVHPYGEGRRYVYPMPHSADTSSRVGLFELDLRVAGTEPSSPVKVHGYQTSQTADGAAKRIYMTQANFMPAGDMVVDYQMVGGPQEMRYWTYQGPAAAAPSVQAAKSGSNRGSAQEVVTAQQTLANDTRPYAVFAIRPELPARTQSRPRDYVIVVDSSQSMVGESHSRVSQLVTGIVAEMDRRDRFTVMACDATCRSKPGGPRSPSSAAATEVGQWLSEIRPAGSSDVILTLSEAANMARQSGSDREVHVLYMGDGQASVGHRRASIIAAQARNLAQTGNFTYTAVGIGGSADTMVLAAIARAGGGHYVPYVPGQRVSAAALSVLETTYGVALRDARLEFPAGVDMVAPTELSTLRAGEEVIVAARFTGEVRGEVILRGTVAGQPYSDRYQIELTPSTAAGNAFVPRLWAARQIEELQLSGRTDEQHRVVALSRAYGVMSRHTSLLVLESEAMFRAFGIDRSRPVIDWTGEEDMDSRDANGEVQQQGPMVYGSARGRGDRSAAAGSRRRARRPAAKSAPSWDGADMAQPTATPPAPTGALGGMAAAEREAAPQEESMSRSAPRRPGRWMKRVWERNGTIATTVAVNTRERQTLAEAEEALRVQPDSRDRHRSLVRALARVGDLARAEQVAEQWLGRDQIDPEALIALSDIIGRQGRREEAIRLLTGIVDLEPDNETLHSRLVDAFERFGQPQRACSHRIAVAESEGADADAIGAAVRCEQSLGNHASATQMLTNVTDATLRRRVERNVTNPPRIRGVNGDLMLEATWSGPQDLDLTLVNSQGQRISWMGGRTNVVGESANSPGREKLGLRWTPVGSYNIEISRTDPADATPVTGQISVRLLGQRRNIPFTLVGQQISVGSVRVRRVARMVPAGF